MRWPFKWLRGRTSAPAFIESRLERLSHYPPMPPPPPPVTPAPEFVPEAASGSAPGSGPAGPSRVKLILADGSESTLSADPDPDLAARAAYLVRRMLPPRPPGSGEGFSGGRPV